jgi:competence protein ComEC
MKIVRFRVVVVLLLGLACCHGLWVSWHFYTQKWPVSWFDQPIQVTGMVSALPQHREHALRFWLQTHEGVVELNWYQPYPILKPGQIWQVWVKVKRPEFQNNPGEFNYARYLQYQGVIASGYVQDRPDNLLLSYQPWRTPAESLRNLVYQKVLYATNGLSMQGILIALILGDKTLLNPVQMEVFERTGTSYFMVISGLHIILFAMLGRVFLRYLWSLSYRATLWLPAQQIGLLAGLFLGLIYSILAGFLVPTQRALWMIGLMGLAHLFLRQYHSLQILFWSLVLVLLWGPFSLYSVAFWLSFLAVFFLIYTLGGRQPIVPIWRRWLHEWFYPQWVMYWALVPIVIYVFQSFSFIGLLTNIIAVPVMILGVIPLALLAAILIFVWPYLGEKLFYLSNQIMDGLWQILHDCALMPQWGITLPQPSFAKMLLAQIGLIIAFAPKGWPGRYLGWLMLLPLFYPGSVINLGQIKVMHLNVAEGQVQVYQTQNHVMVVEDVAHLKAAKASIQYVLVPFLQAEGVKQVELWVLNFKGKDTALQSLQNAWLPLQVEHLVTSVDYQIYDSQRSNCALPQQFKFDGVTVQVAMQAGRCQIFLPAPKLSAAQSVGQTSDE